MQQQQPIQPIQSQPNPNKSADSLSQQKSSSQSMITTSINQSIQIAKLMTKYLIIQFEQELKINKLLMNLSQYNTHKTKILYQQCLSYFHLEGESKMIRTKQSNYVNHNNNNKQVNNNYYDQNNKNKQINNNNNHNNYYDDQDKNQDENNNKINNINSSILIKCNKIKQNYNQDIQPIACKMDSIINFHIKLQHTNQQNEQNKSDQLLSLNYSKSNNFYHNNINSSNQSYRFQQTSAQVKQQQQYKLNESTGTFQNNTNSNPPLHTPQLIPLATPAIASNQLIQQQEQQKQLDKLKQHLYNMRRYRKINIEEERQRLEQNNKKKHKYMFFNKNIEHTYQYDGIVLDVKKNDNINGTNKKNQLLIHNINNNKNKNNNKDNKQNKSNLSTNRSSLKQSSIQQLQSKSTTFNIKNPQLDPQLTHKQYSYNNKPVQNVYYSTIQINVNYHIFRTQVQKITQKQLFI